MILAFDTNILIEIDLLNRHIMDKLEELKKTFNPVLPSPVVSEYYYGFLGTPGKERALKSIEDYTILNTSKDSAMIFADIKHKLRKTGITISDMDLLIASICIDNDTTLVTMDNQFKKIDELKKIIL